MQFTVACFQYTCIVHVLFEVTKHIHTLQKITFLNYAKITQNMCKNSFLKNSCVIITQHY